jgi:hypothetical protein
VTEVATPEPATERGCPRCGAALAPDQEWCLACGTAVATRVAPTPRWRAPVALVGALLALLAAALLLALVELSRDPQPVAKATPVPAAATPTPAPAPAPTTAPTPTPTPAGSDDSSPGAGPGGSAAPSGELATWPAGRTAWTVVLASAPSRTAARRSARQLAAPAAGAPLGLLDASDYPSLGSGWFVFSGQYESRAKAAKAAEPFGPTAQPRRVVPG